jgi:hypothetical protein
MFEHTGEARIIELSTGLSVWFGAPVFPPNVWRDVSYTEEAVVLGRGFATYAGAGLSYIDVKSATSREDDALGGFLHVGCWKGLSRPETAFMAGIELRYTFASDLIFAGGERWDMDGPQLLFVFVASL